ATWQERCFQESNGALHFSLGFGSVRLSATHLETVESREVGKLALQHRMILGISPDRHGPQVVVEHLERHTTEEDKRCDVHALQDQLVHRGRETREELARVA